MRKVEPYTTKDGRARYKVRFRLGGKQTSEVFETKREADRFAKTLDAVGAQAAVDQLYAGEQESHVPTLDQVAADHIDVLTSVTDGTRLSYRRLWDRTWGTRFGKLPANRLTRDTVARAVNDLAQTYSAKSLKNQHSLLSAVCKRAVELGYLPANPARGIRLPRGREDEREDMRILTYGEFNQLLTVLHPHYRPLVMFLYGMGCRWGEAVVLRVSDVNPPNVRIRRALKWSPDSNRVVGPTKTRKSNRTIVMPPELVDVIRPLLAGKKGSELVFTAPRGGPVQHRTFWSDIWRPAVDKAGLEPRPRLHDLRHSHASNLLAAGVPIHVVQARLGHEDISTTVGTYGHLLPDAQLQAAQAASLAFRGTPPELEP